MLEVDRKWKGALFNTTCLIGPEGVLYKYRKVNTWIPYEVHTSPHDIEGYDEPLFPVAETAIGRIGCADMLRLAIPGGDAAARGKRSRDPRPRFRLHGSMERHGADGLVDRDQPCPGDRKHRYVVAANQAASLKNYPPYSWSGGSQIIDFDGRILADASPGPGERIVVAPIDTLPSVMSGRHVAATICSLTCARTPTRSIVLVSTRR